MTHRSFDVSILLLRPLANSVWRSTYATTEAIRLGGWPDVERKLWPSHLPILFLKSRNIRTVHIRVASLAGDAFANFCYLAFSPSWKQLPSSILDSRLTQHIQTDRNRERATPMLFSVVLLAIGLGPTTKHVASRPGWDLTTLPTQDCAKNVQRTLAYKKENPLIY
jgi:hypothetical protein